MKENSVTSDVGEVSELLIRSDGKIFAHNVTPAMAGLLAQLNPEDAAMRERALQEIQPAVRADENYSTFPNP